MKTTVEWIRADERLPMTAPVIVAAVTGRCPGEPDDDPASLDGQEFRLVLTTYFRRVQPVEETGEIIAFLGTDFVLTVRCDHGCPDH